MIKFKFYMDKDAETEWLNEMSGKGWAMKSFFAGFYVFDKCEEGEYIYQVDLGERLFKVSDGYKEFMEDVGIEIIQTWGWWVFLRKPASEGKFELYTDVESSIEHYTKVRKMLKIVTIIELICLWMEIMAATVGEVPYAVIAAFVIGAILVGAVRMVIHTTGIIDSLRERQSGMPVERKRNVSMVLATGCLLNAVALLGRESVSHNIIRTVQIVAIVLMVIGIWDTFRKNGR